ncbi:META domain-containing protein [Marinimicrobium sp. ARAG 43.8]|uniref:META domain-containing protein n=1 Tax=Marinimicrobium sp. ARAG 43.8 TaxID=3418719 RepID=UPI003CF23B2C
MPNRSQWISVLAITAGLMMLVGCQSPSMSDSDDGQKPLTLGELQGRWQIQSVDGVVMESGGRAFIEFSEPPRLTGNGGCNRFFGMYRFTEGELFIEPAVGSTKMACEPQVMVQEQQLFDVLPQAVETELSAKGELTLSDADGQPLVTAVRWQ